MTPLEGLHGAPLAPLVGPFPHREFLDVWWTHFDGGELRVIAAPEARLPIVVEAGTARIAGEAHLTDYHSPLGSDVAGLATGLIECAPVLVLDSLPVEAADPLVAELERAGARVSRSRDEPSMVLDLEEAEHWEEALGSRDRHEVRRKRRRFARRHGTPRVEDEPSAIGRFIDLHRSAGGDKGGFMTPAMASFFEELTTVEGARLDTLRGRAGGILAVAFGFEDRDGYYLYNTAYDRQASGVSPGIVLIDRLIARTAASGRHRFDFLKGAESYKARLGAVERPLHVLEAHL